MDEVFRALNDPSRRLLLDRLFDRDGQTLGQLCEHLPDMTRYGVMNHLRVLEEGGLITSRKVGRSKLHFLNPVPIRLIHDRWISKYTEAVSSALAALTNELEGDTGMETPSHIYQTYIKCRPEDAWRAITDGDLTVQYFYGTRVESSWEPGSPISYLGGNGSVVADGEIIAIDAPTRLEMTFLARWDPDLEADGPARMAWIVDEANGATRVTVEYYDLAQDDRRAVDFMEGIPFIVGGMKTLLETGAPLASV